jgi:hypothetical protein
MSRADSAEVPAATGDYVDRPNHRWMLELEETVVAKVREEAMERRLRWMCENLNGAYTARHPKGHSASGGYCTNSGTCIIACCYINALGKVLLKGGPPKRGPSRHPRPDFARFHEFLHLCMSDFLTESGAMTWSPTPRGRPGSGDEWLYEVFRCGFVHGYPGTNVTWGRSSRSNRYWRRSRGRLMLSIDGLVRGFQRGVVEFRRLADADPDLRSRFMEYIVAD